METIRNKVAESGLITIDLDQYYPQEDPLVFDLKNFLFREMLLREKDFREAMEQHDWTVYQNKHVAVCCSSEAIIPMWAYMLVASKLTPVASRITVGNLDSAIREAFLNRLQQLDASQYADKRVIIKGCGEKEIPPYAYLAITEHLMPHVKSLMYGEPCSTVPVYKKK
jgi:hypothetical protein